VALVTDPEKRSSDLVASGVIKRVEPSTDLKEKITRATPASLAAVYAEAGIWYDALAVLSDQIEAQPDNQSLRETRSDLLRQVGLKTAAAAESAGLKP
jgi:predicted Zn-dependent protease